MLTDSSRAQRGQQTGQADQRFHTSGGPGGRSAISRSLLTSVLVLASALIIVVLVWQAVVAHGDPDPTAAHGSQAVAVLDIGVLTLREGLECILVLAAITASMVGPTRRYRRPVAAGAAFGFVVTILTWWVAVAIVQDLTQSFSALAVQAVTGLLAIVVLLVVMNWFFHRVYWTGWIAVHTKKKRELVKDAQRQSVPTARVLWGFGLLGFTSLYREGVEVVLFLQSYRLKLGPVPVREGVLIGLVFTAVVAILTFVAHRRLPYRQMLVLTGVLLTVVLLVMVGEQAQEMQLVHWLPTTPIHSLDWVVRPWMELWLSIFPTVQTLAAQAIAAVFVLGSYALVRSRMRRATNVAIAA